MQTWMLHSGCGDGIEGLMRCGYAHGMTYPASFSLKKISAWTGHGLL